MLLLLTVWSKESVEQTTLPTCLESKNAFRRERQVLFWDMLLWLLTICWICCLMFLHLTLCCSNQSSNFSRLSIYLLVFLLGLSGNVLFWKLTDFNFMFFKCFSIEELSGKKHFRVFCKHCALSLWKLNVRNVEKFLKVSKNVAKKKSKLFEKFTKTALKTKF